MAYDLLKTEIFDVNGQKYRVGLDGHGYVQIQTGDMWENPGTGELEFHPSESDDRIDPHVILDQETAREVANRILELAD